MSTETYQYLICSCETGLRPPVESGAGTGGSAMEQNNNNNNNEQEKKKINEDLVVFMRKRSDHDAPRYTARLKTYVDIHRKRRRAAAARRFSDYICARKGSAGPIPRKKTDEKEKPETKLVGPGSPHPPDSAVAVEQQLNMACFPGKASEHPGSEDGRMSRRGVLGRRGCEEKGLHGRSPSRSRSRGEPSDSCRRRRRRRCGGRRKRRRRSRRRRRRRRSCRRRRRRRRRSCSRRRRRRSCRRRRRKRRRC